MDLLLCSVSCLGMLGFVIRWDWVMHLRSRRFLRLPSLNVASNTFLDIKGSSFLLVRLDGLSHSVEHLLLLLLSWALLARVVTEAPCLLFVSPTIRLNLGLRWRANRGLFFSFGSFSSCANLRLAVDFYIAVFIWVLSINVTFIDSNLLLARGTLDILWCDNIRTDLFCRHKAFKSKQFGFLRTVPIGCCVRRKHFYWLAIAFICHYHHLLRFWFRLLASLFSNPHKHGKFRLEYIVVQDVVCSVIDSTLLLRSLIFRLCSSRNFFVNYVAGRLLTIWGARICLVALVVLSDRVLLLATLSFSLLLRIRWRLLA